MASEAKLHSDSDRGREQFLSKIKLLKKKNSLEFLLNFRVWEFLVSRFTGLRESITES